MKKITILCTDPQHPVNPKLMAWSHQYAKEAEISILRDSRELAGGDYLFLVSCHQIIDADMRSKFRYTLVLHASALPEGRGLVLVLVTLQ